MMLRLGNIVKTAIDPALALLPKFMDSKPARVMLLAIGLQESRFEYRRQLGNGPARGYWQFEQGGGVKGVWKHSKTTEYLRGLCRERDCGFDPKSIWGQLETDDVLAAGVARLLLFSDPFPLPSPEATDVAWNYYERNWKPGKPHPETWPALHARAREEVFPPEPAIHAEDA